MKWKIAAAQIVVTDSIEQNLQEILKAIRTASKNNADIVCLPETCLINEEEHTRRITKEVKTIRDLAKEKNINVVFGSYVLDDEQKIRNRIFVIDRTGEVVLRYNKRNLYRDESAIIVAGKRNRLATLDGIHIAVINCWDYAFPEDIRDLASRGAEVIFCPSYLLSHPQTHNVLYHIPQVRAFDCMAYFVMVDAFAEETYKHSKICHPLHRIADIKNKAGIAYGEIDTSEIKKLRKEFPNLKKNMLIS